MDDISECDWAPPPRVSIVESEIYEIQSGPCLPSIEDFIKSELEKEELTKPEVEEILDDEVLIETHTEIQYSSLPEEPLDDASIAEDQEEIAAIETEEDDFELPPVDTKPKLTSKKKHTVEIIGVDSISSLDRIKRRAERKRLEKIRTKLIQDTDDLIDNIIADVVQMCQYDDPDDELRHRLDGDKIMYEIDETISELESEQNVRLFLNLKVIQYFQEKNLLRTLIDDSPYIVFDLIRKHEETLLMIGKYQLLVEPAQQVLDTTIPELKNELESLRTEFKLGTQTFFDMVKKLFNIDSFEKNEAVEYLMNKFKSMEQEIRKVRHYLIKLNHEQANLEEENETLDNIGHGLRISYFENVQAESKSLGEKIEERTNELNELRATYNANIHFLAHTREKQRMQRSTILDQQLDLKELLEEKQNCRKYLNDLKIERHSIRTEFQKQRFKKGLFRRPKFLRDYDATVNDINKMKAAVNQLESEDLELDEKLNEIKKANSQLKWR
ncbi:synaptonemal complex protein 1-like [Eupeodes corollae]|uniref:synaptonemal complex protein 1-like n=1 Tax=Eupeodes corollae TaxID=290404 RepID=UPI00248FDDD0|nr:synaptonemal complex protein 1-like [Eupeodes corollae]